MEQITYPQHKKSPENSKIIVPKIGGVKLSNHREIPKDAIIKTMELIKEAGRWFVCFSTQVSIEMESKSAPLPPIGIDMGLIDFLYTSGGDNVPAPKYHRKKEKEVKRLQRRLSKAEKRTPRYYKILRALQKCHYRIKCQRTDFLHKQANRLLSSSDIIFHEDLSIKNMSCRPKPKTDESGEYFPNGAAGKSGLNKSISDVGCTSFLRSFGINPMSLERYSFRFFRPVHLKIAQNVEP